MDRGKIPVDLIMAKLEADAKAARHRLERARDIFHGPLATDIGATPYDLVYQEDRVRLKYYRPEAARLKTPLLLMHGLFNRETLLDLQPDRSIVHHLLKEGVEVYLIDWGSPTRRDQFLTLDDHINGYLDDMVEFDPPPARGSPGESHGGVPGGDLRGHLCGAPPGKDQEPDHHRGSHPL